MQQQQYYTGALAEAAVFSGSVSVSVSSSGSIMQEHSRQRQYYPAVLCSGGSNMRKRLQQWQYYAAAEAFAAAAV